MVREGDHTLSSIALLQERFRQLQKMKEQRQERELLRMLSESERYSPPTIINNNHHQLQSKQFPGSSEPVFLPADPMPHCQLSLSLWPDDHSHIKINADTPVAAGVQSKSAWFTDHICSKTENSASHIDTSLRL